MNAKETWKNAGGGGGGGSTDNGLSSHLWSRGKNSSCFMVRKPVSSWKITNKFATHVISNLLMATTGAFLVLWDSGFKGFVRVLSSGPTARTLNKYHVSDSRFLTVSLSSFRELTAVFHGCLPFLLRNSTTYMMSETSEEVTELHAKSTELCVTEVTTTSKGGSVGFGVGIVVGGDVVVMITSE